MNWLESISGPTWSEKQRLYAKHVKHVRKAKFADKICPPNLSKLTKTTFLLPRKAYGIDFYDHAKGEILVAIDLCTREVNLWFLTDRKTEGVTKALLSGILFQKGVPLLFVNDEASEFVGGTVHAMNQYLRY